LKTKFDKDGYKVNNVHGIILVETRRKKKLYIFNINVQKENANVAKSTNEKNYVLAQMT
jgi:hypothetical protein